MYYLVQLVVLKSHVYCFVQIPYDYGHLMSEIDKKKISLDIKKVVNQASDNFSSTVDSRYLEVKGTL